MKKAYTLIEVMLVVALIGIIFAISLPRFGYDILVQYRARTTAHRIVSDLRFTRSQAIENGANYILQTSPLLCQYSIYKGSIATGNQVGDTRIIDPTVVLSGGSQFTFESGGNASLTSGTSLLVTAGTHVFTITITQATGKVTMQGQ